MFRISVFIGFFKLSLGRVDDLGLALVGLLDIEDRTRGPELLLISSNLSNGGRDVNVID